MRKTKKVADSQTTMTELILPTDTNVLGNLKGGRLLHLMDIVGALVASRHSNKQVATVAMDKIVFEHPIHLGAMIMLEAHLVKVGTTSMTVLVTVHSENLKTGEQTLTNTATLTFVALDDDGKPTEVPLLEP